MLGSGLSFSHRHLGYGVDNVVSFDAVLANGTIVTADACSNTDLFWALRGGGGGSFAVVRWGSRSIIAACCRARCTHCLVACLRLHP